VSIKNSNLYVEKIFAEHPLGLWAFDDDVSYRQFLDPITQNLADPAWIHTNHAIITAVDYPDAPIDRAQTRIKVNSGSAAVVSFIGSSFGLGTDMFDQSRGTITVSTNVHHEAQQIFQYEIGTVINSVETSTIYPAFLGWQTLVHTVDLPDPTDYVSLFIRIHCYSGGGVVRDVCRNIKWVPSDCTSIRSL
jgi:hypothetical protein